MELTFTEEQFDAVICLNGDLPGRQVFLDLAGRPLIAADGATNVLHQHGIGPEFIVGDLDSVHPETLDAFRGTSEVIVDRDQNSTDFEKALRFAESQLWKRLLVIGIHGGDLEHTLNNWSVLMRHGRSLELTALDRARYAIPVYGSFTFYAAPREMISLIPQPLATLTTSGLEWELTNEALEMGTREGARNRVAEHQVSADGGSSHRVTIDLHSGSLLFFCDARFPKTPLLGQPTNP